ncbi:MAG: hypothetical protein AAGI90_00105 [Chlamydiota bacterium]
MKKKPWTFFTKIPKEGWGVGMKRSSPYEKKKKPLKDIVKKVLEKKLPTS